VVVVVVPPPVVVVVAEVVDVVLELPVVVVVPEEVAVAMTGEIGDPAGARATMPVGAELFEYGWQVRLRSLPDTTRVSATSESTVREMAPPPAVNGPTVAGVDGSMSVKPAEGTGEGMGTLMASAPDGIDAGVAPAASTAVSAVPMMAEFPRAAAAPTMAPGSATVDW
jgi:hypothetical protein